MLPVSGFPGAGKTTLLTYFLLWITATCEAKFLWASSTNGPGVAAANMFHAELGMVLGSHTASFVARFPAAKTDRTTPLHVPSSGRMQSLSQAIHVVILMESHGARDVLQKYGGLRSLAPFHGIIFDEAQMFGSPYSAVLGNVL